MIFTTKKPGHCLACGEPTFEIREHAEATAETRERWRLGAMLDSGTQVEFLLSDGTCAHLDMCVDCATALQPEDYLAAWDAVLDRTAERLRDARPNERRRKLGRLARVWPMAVLRWRRQDPATGRIVVDRRFEGVTR